MNTAHATYHDGQIQLDEPVDWPSGTRAVVVPETSEQNCDSSESDFILRDEDWPSTPEALQEWVEWCRSREPVMSLEEQTQFEAALKASKAEQIELMRRAWEQPEEQIP